jgi:hypothetical protein
MSLPLPINVTVDIYRTANPSSPYPGGSPAVAGVRGYLKPAMTNGRSGNASWLRWTHILYLPPGTDVRDAYNSQLDPARNNTLADTVILTDTTVPSRKTAYYVVFVEVIARGTPQQHLRAYLDRFLPSGWPTDSL